MPDDTIYLSLAPFVFQDPHLAQIRVTASYGAELEEALTAAGLEPSRVVEMSATVDTAVWLLGPAGGVAGLSLVLKQLAPILEAFFRRHKDKKIRMVVGGDEIEVTGGSLPRMQGVIEQTFERSRKEQADAWARTLESSKQNETKADVNDQP